MSDLQSDIAVSDGKITGTLNYISTGTLARDWGAGNFMVLKFSGIDPLATSAKVGMSPSQGSGLVELDEDMNGVFKVTDKDAQKFVVQLSNADGHTETFEYDLSELEVLGE